MTHRESNQTRFHKENTVKNLIHRTVRGAAVVAALALSAPAQASLVGLWEFDNAANVGEGTVGIDLTANDNAAHTASGQTGGGLALDGTNDYLGGAPTVPLGDSSYTISAWISTTTGGNRGIVGFGDYGSNGEVNATRLAGTTDLVNYSWGGPNDIQRNSGITLTSGTWHHVAAVYDSATSTKTLYVNGAQIGSASVLGGNLAVTAANFRIGSTNGGEFFDGTLDDVAIFDDALSATVIGSIANGASATDTALVGLWRFDDAGDLGRDSSVHGNHTTAQGDSAYSASGKYGGAASLDGAGDFFDRAAGIDRLPIGDSDYTIAAWIDADTTGARGIVGYGDYGSNSEVNALRIHEDNRLRHYWWADDLDSADVSAQSVNLDADGWVHVAVTYDGTTRTIWLNGVAITSDTPGAHAAADSNFRIGSTNFGEFFDGQMDDVAIFNIALGQSELQTIMSGNFAAFGIPTPAALPAGLVMIGIFGARRRRRA